MDNHTTKTCTKCGQTFPATTEYFHYQEGCKGNLRPNCKECHSKKSKEWRENNPEKKRENDRKWTLENAERKKANDKAYYEANSEKIKARSRQYEKDNRHIVRVRKRAYVAKRKEHVRNYMKNYYASHLDERKSYIQANRPRIRIVKNVAFHRRRARKLALPNTFTTKEWLACLEYFNHCCAVCGRQLRDLLGTVKPNQDHWIPISHPSCTGTVSKNMICLCNHCNGEKKAKLPLDWLTEKYGIRKAKQILARIEAYFEGL